MNSMKYLYDVLILLSVSMCVVVIFKQLRLSPVLGYLIAGAIISEHCLDLIRHPEYAIGMSKFGVVFLLFVIGLEMSIERLVKMRWYVFGFGSMQIIITACILYPIIYHYMNVSSVIAIMIALALALSSTAVVLQVLSESNRGATQVGRLALAVLLMQDFTVVPLLVILPLLSTSHDGIELFKAVGWAGLRALGVILLITLASRLFLRPLFSLLSSAKNEEVYITATLLIVLGVSGFTEHLGLSEAMGAFLAGILIAETEYRHRVEDSVMPFKGLLLGLFFLSTGMSIDVNFIIDKWNEVFLASIVLLTVKASVIFLLCKIFKFSKGTSYHASLLLAQGGEFAFILFTIAAKKHILSGSEAQFLLMVVAFTMALTPLLSIIGAKIEEKLSVGESERVKDTARSSRDLENHVIICGFGRTGRVIAYMLAQEKINYIALDNDPGLVMKAREEGYPVYKGDPIDDESLKAVGADRASVIVLTMKERLVLNKAVRSISSRYKDITIITRVQDYRHHRGVKKLGASRGVPEVVEVGLQLGTELLSHLSISYNEVIALKEKIRDNEYILLDDIELFKGLKPSKRTSDD